VIGADRLDAEQLDVHQVEPQITLPAELKRDPFEGTEQALLLTRPEELVGPDRTEPLPCFDLDRDQDLLIGRCSQPIDLGPARAHIAPQAGPALREQALMAELLGGFAGSVSRVG